MMLSSSLLLGRRWYDGWWWQGSIIMTTMMIVMSWGALLLLTSRTEPVGAWQTNYHHRHHSFFQDGIRVMRRQRSTSTVIVNGFPNSKLRFQSGRRSRTTSQKNELFLFSGQDNNHHNCCSSRRRTSRKDRLCPTTNNNNNCGSRSPTTTLPFMLGMTTMSRESSRDGEKRDNDDPCSFSKLPRPCVWELNDGPQHHPGRGVVVEEESSSDIDMALTMEWSEVFVSCTDNNNQNNKEGPSLDDKTSIVDDNDTTNKELFSLLQQPVTSTVLAAQQTWNWCQHFVVSLKLCPWAKTSLDTPLALQLFVVHDEEKNSSHLLLGTSSPNNNNDSRKKKKGSSSSSKTSSFSRLEQEQRLLRWRREIVKNVADKFQEFLELHPSLESSAIFFIVFVPPKRLQGNIDDTDDSSTKTTSNTLSFEEFYNWFIDLEDDWELIEEVTLAPFHPDWQFVGGSDDDDEEEGLQLSYEKKTPFPTITLVSTRTIDQAGPIVTDQIAQSNYDTLTTQSVQELQKRWNNSIHKKN